MMKSLQFLIVGTLFLAGTVGNIKDFEIILSIEFSFKYFETIFAKNPQSDTDHRVLKPFLHWLRKKDSQMV